MEHTVNFCSIDNCKKVLPLKRHLKVKVSNISSINTSVLQLLLMLTNGSELLVKMNLQELTLTVFIWEEEVKI